MYIYRVSISSKDHISKEYCEFSVYIYCVHAVCLLIIYLLSLYVESCAVNKAFNKKHESIYQWQVGGTNLFNSSKDFSDRYSCTNATVTTIMIAYEKM